MRTYEALQNRASSSDVDRHAPPRNVSIGSKCRRKRLKRFALVFHFPTGEHRLDDLDAFAHHGCRANLFPLFAFADFFHENLRSAKAKEKTVLARSLLKDASFHGDLNGMTRVRRNDAPSDGDFFGFAGDYGGDCC